MPVTETLLSGDGLAPAFTIGIEMLAESPVSGTNGTMVMSASNVRSARLELS